MKIKLVLVLSLSFLTIYNAFAQEQSDIKTTEKHIHSLGIGAGLTTGHGLSYRYLPTKFGVQVNFLPYSENEEFNYFVGLTFLYKVIETDITNFFVYQGNRYEYSKQKIYDYNSPEVTTEEVINHRMNNGVGIGIEFIIFKRISLNIMGGYAFKDNFKNIGLTGEGGLYYMF